MNATILLFCSDPVIRSVLGETLEAHGYVVLPVGDLGAAVDRLREYKPDLLIIRTYVDNMAGHDAAQYLRTRRPGMRILIVSGLIDDERLNYRESVHRIEVFPKPFTAADLLEKVRDVLATRQSHATQAPSSGRQT
jgi:DNA-binding response OmpR family regulator